MCAVVCEKKYEISREPNNNKKKPFMFDGYDNILGIVKRRIYILKKRNPRKYNKKSNFLRKLPIVQLTCPES